ncbi:MAG: hypothetical protein M1818_000961 [Claussenomyces sp. TS43310]|nr:MAG: hypothetical protein M1818_000961 [Claussenomyces sp. TS43310]
MSKYLNKSIPLLCSLCPKEPRFSDISHLLTHVSSKSHLSHRFKLQIRSQGEPDARQQLENYETWYAENGLEDLLSERLASKEHKKLSKRTRMLSVPVKAEAKTEVKKEIKKHVQLSTTPKYRAPVPRMHTWSTGMPAVNYASQETLDQWKQDGGYETPTTHKSIPNFDNSQPSPDCADNIAIEPTPLRSEETEDERDLDTSKLKGILWPGMDLFDSATTEMKRKRNQKKDGSVLAQMMLNSAVVEPNEWVFNAEGDIHKIKPIFGDSTDTSPVRSEIVPTPKKRRTRKATQANTDTHASQLHPSFAMPSLRKVPRKRGPPATDAGDVSSRMFANPLGPLNNTQFIPNAEEDEEFRLTMEGMMKKPTFGIFRDAEDASPGRTESPLDDLKHSFPHHYYPLQPLNRNSMLDMSPTPVFKPTPLRFSDKENLHTQAFDRRHVSSATGFPPQMFHDHSVNPLIFPSHAHLFTYEDHDAFHGSMNPPSSTLDGDFKAVMQPTSLLRPGHHGLMMQTQSTGQSTGNNTHFRM